MSPPRAPTPPPAADPLVRAFLPLVRGELAAHYRPDCCIAATRIACDVLAHYGVPVRPLPVVVLVYNAPFVARLNRGAPYPTNPAETLRWAREDGSWALGIGQGPSRPGHWSGHLVALVGADPPPSGGPLPGLLDLTLDQADRPQRAIRLGPLYVPASPAFLASQARLVRTLHGCLVAYEVTANCDFRATPDWRDASHRAPLVARLIHHLDAALGHPPLGDLHAVP